MANESTVCSDSTSGKSDLILTAFSREMINTHSAAPSGRGRRGRRPLLGGPWCPINRANHMQPKSTVNDRMTCPSTAAAAAA
jgi:hypothetical protein